MSYFPGTDTFVLVQNCNFPSTSTTDRYHYSAPGTPLNASYLNAYISGFDSTQSIEAEDWGAGSVILPWACTLIQVDCQISSVYRDETDDLELIVAKCDSSSVSSGDGPDIDVTKGVTMAMAANTGDYGEGFGWCHAHSQTTSLAFAANDSFMLFVAKTANNATYNSAAYAILTTLTFQRT